MDKISLSIPEKRQPARPIETRPKEAEAWLQSLPYNDTAEAARLIYQSLFALNRTEVAPRDRFEIMDLYMRPVGFVTEGLQAHLKPLVLPLPPKKMQLADFLRQLQVEMANGYKSVLGDIIKGARLDRTLTSASIERAIRCFGEVFLRSYEVYMPYPGGIWGEVHALYDLAERQGLQHDPVPAPREEQGVSNVSRRYKQLLLLALCGPYQLPHRECNQVYGFLDIWADKALVVKPYNGITNPVGHFLIDLAADAPPIVFPRDIRIDPLPPLRVLNAIGLTSIVHSFISRIQKGETPKTLDLGADCQGSACTDMLRRMLKFWGLSVRRQFSRTKKRGRLGVCVGLDAVHFFVGGQVPLRMPEPAVAGGAEAQIDLDLMAEERPSPEAAKGSFRIDQWEIQDESAAGFALARAGHGGAWVRVGDLLGIEGEAGNWRVGVARWLKSADTFMLEMGVEMISPRARAVAVKPAAVGSGEPYRQALLLPPVPPLRTSSTLLLPRGLYHEGKTLSLMQHDTGKLIRPTGLLERTGAFEHVAFTEITPAPAPVFNSEVVL